MDNFKIRLVKKDEFEELMQLMNTAFNFNEDIEKFEHILPKLYFNKNKDMIHYGVYVDNKLVASIGLYTMKFISKYHSLKVGCVGAVSTHPDYRNNGYFSLLMPKIIAYAKRHKFDTLFLGGNRFRYNHFGFENAGRKLIVNISQRTKNVLKPQEFVVQKLEKENLEDIQKCLNLYNKELQHVDRTSENFYDHVVTWNCEPYVVKVDDEIVGYYSIKNNSSLFELIYKKEFFDTVLMASLGDKDSITVQLPYSSYFSLRRILVKL